MTRPSERNASELPITITPQLNCKWRWIDRQALSCHLNGQDRMTQSTKYTITVNPGIAAMDVYESEGTFEQAAALEPTFEDILHSFADHDKVIDVRNCGLMGAIELAPRDGAPGARGLEIHKKCFWDEQLVVRNGMDVLQLSPFLNSKEDERQHSCESSRRGIDSSDVAGQRRRPLH